MAQQRRVRAVVSGSVQGVFFRARLRDVADELGLAGWVRNRPDGRVEAELQGGPDSVDRAIAFCEEGPEHAQVAGVDVDDLEPIPGAAGFQVR